MVGLTERTKHEITRRADALYLLRGCEPGRDVEDWVRAERELSDESVGGPAPTIASLGCAGAHP